jgi:hypothetical protein
MAERRGRRRAQALSRAIADLPAVTRRAMLDAAETEELIVGAYTDRAGRMCPMLAAHRRGARTHVGGFPRAWDAFGRTRRPRPATDRELAILRALLQESLSGGPAAGGAVPDAVAGEETLSPAGGAL